MNSKRNILRGFFIFLGFMFVCMLVSKSIYASRLPIVDVVMPESKYVEHDVKAQGIVVAGSESAVTALAGLRVESVQVRAGERVQEGDVLFLIDREDLGRLIKEKQSEVDALSLQIAAIEKNQELARQKKALEGERAREDYDRTAQEEDTDVGRAAQRYAEAQEALEEHLQKLQNEPWSESWQQEQKQLEKALQQAAYDEAEAKRERDHAMTQAQRTIEDNALPDNADSTLSVYRAERQKKQEELVRYQAVEEAQGEIRAATEGIVTNLFVEAGKRVPDTASLFLADEDTAYRFRVLLNEKQKEHVRLNSSVTIKLDGSGTMEASVDYLAQSTAVQGGFEAYMVLPQGVGAPGASGTFFCADKGEKYSLCIPTAALHETETRSFVYILREREGILGQECYVEEMTVKVLDKNEDWAAVEGGVDGQSNVIVFSDKEIKKGETVRRGG